MWWRRRNGPVGGGQHQFAAIPVASDESLEAREKTRRGHYRVIKVTWAQHESIRSPALPCVDQVLGQADAGGRAGDGDLPIGRSLHWVGDLDLCPWHLTDLIDLGTLTADDAANQLSGLTETHPVTFQQHFSKLNAQVIDHLKTVFKMCNIHTSQVLPTFWRLWGQDHKYIYAS